MPPHAFPDHPLPTVLLRHELPDGSWHIDWMLGQDPQGHDRLLTFRLPRSPIGLAATETMLIERIGEHRRDYLEYEGPVSAGRGTVKRIASGHIVAWSDRDEGWELNVKWEDEQAGDDSPETYRLEPIEDSHWRLRRLSS